MKTLRSTFRTILIAAPFVLGSAAYAQQPFNSTTNTSTPGLIGPPVQFERDLMDFNSQGLDQENCVNLSLVNRTDRPRALTGLYSADPAHYKIASPTSAMLPITIGPYSSMYVAICFKTSRPGQYNSRVVAVFNSDSAVLQVHGMGLGDSPALQDQFHSFETDLRVSEDFTLHPKKAAVKNVSLMVDPKSKLPQNTIYLSLNSQSGVTLVLTDALGKVVRKFFDNEGKAMGEYAVMFDGRDQNEKPLEPGGYVLRAEIKDLQTQQLKTFSKHITLKK